MTGSEVERSVSLCLRAARLASESRWPQLRTVAHRHRVLRKARRLIVVGRTVHVLLDDESRSKGPRTSGAGKYRAVKYRAGARERASKDIAAGRGEAREDWPFWYPPENLLCHPDHPDEVVPLSRLSPMDWYRHPAELVMLHRYFLFNGWIYPGWRYVICSPLDYPGRIAIGYDTMAPVKDKLSEAKWWARCPLAAPASEAVPDQIRPSEQEEIRTRPDAPRISASPVDRTWP